MSWRPLLDAHSEEHARRAAPDALASLAERLPGAPGPDRAATLAELLLGLESEADVLSAAVRDRRERIRAAPAGPPRRAVLERILDEIGRGADRVALGRWLDAEAIADQDRLAEHRSWQQRQLLAEVLARMVADDNPLGSLAEPLADRLTTWLGDPERPWLLRAAYVRLLAAMAGSVDAITAAQTVREQALGGRPVWVQVAALEAYVALRPAEGRGVAVAVLAPPAERWPHLPDDHAFVRARAAGLAARAGALDAVVAALDRPDPSEMVRQAAIRALVEVAPERARVWLSGRTDASWRVRAAGWVAQLPDVGRSRTGDWAAALVEPLRDEDGEVRGVLVRAVLDRRRLLADRLPAAAQTWAPVLQQLADEDPGDVGESAALLVRWLRVQADDRSQQALVQLEAWLDGATEGDRRAFDAPLATLPDAALHDVLAVAAADRFDLSADRRGARLRVRFGAPRRPALWRVLHEALTPAPDKRQAYDHLGDEVHAGSIQALSRRLAEVTPTRVPGMRVATTETLAWGSHLPLVSQLLGAARRPTTHVITPRGRLTVRRTVPSWRAWWALHRHYVALDGVRRTQVGRGPDGVAIYDRAIAEHGVELVRERQSAGWPEVAALVAEAVRADSNTLGDLTLVAGVMLGGWVARNLWVNRSVRAQRRAVPLVVGGWGSRGKSGTERLKAALFHGLGYRVVAKTTGCEAMFIASTPGNDPVEVFLFRPFDKATIVEQRDVLRMAASLDAQVMTWECMALRPGFVDVLQRQWMRDDVSTVTNTYPDHEDIQGPSGRDVAETISGFLPRRAVAFSTEQHMHPVLAQEARRVGTALTAVRPERWQLLPADAMARFPYQAHPRNVALVLAMADHLGVPDDLALHRMAECVVPDLGVLKEYGPAAYRGRAVSFVNGCSANERAGFLSNWSRMGLGEVGPETGLTDRLAIVFNNRADRLARQKVFARIAVHDATADAMVLIGTNVGSFAVDFREGLARELGPALKAMAADGTPGARAELLDAIRRHLRRPAHPPEDAVRRAVAFAGEAHRDALAAAVSGPLVTRQVADGEVTPVAAAAQWVREVCWLHGLQVLDRWEVDAVVDELLQLLGARLKPLVDPRLTGDQVLHAIATTAPEGSTLRILGAENIKGTGLDFVYRWISLDKTLGLLSALEAADQATEARAALAALATHADWGLIDLELAVEVLSRVEAAGELRLLGVDAEASALHAELAARQKVRAEGLTAGREAGWLDRLLGGLEAWLDPIDSVRRRRIAIRLYRDLGTRRVGVKRAAVVAKKLTSRQKGGWLRWTR